MSFIIVDGFDDRYWLTNGDVYGGIWDGWGLYDELYLGNDWDNPDFGGSRELGRYGGWCPHLPDNDTWGLQYLVKTVSSSNTFCGGIALQGMNVGGHFFSAASPTKYGPILEFDDGGRIELTRSRVGSGNEYLAWSDAGARLTVWGWHYITFQFSAGNVGSDWIKVWIDGELVMDISGTTLNYGGAITEVAFPGTVYGFDDIWLRNDTNIIDEPQILAIFPNAAGTDSECTPVGEATNYLNVDEFEQDFDSTYNLVATAEKDSFNMDAITAQISSGVVHALVARFFVKGDVGNAVQLRPYVISGGTKYNGTAQSVVEGRYTYIQEIWETNPDTSVAWTLSEIDAVQIGYEGV